MSVVYFGQVYTNLPDAGYGAGSFSYTNREGPTRDFYKPIDRVHSKYSTSIQNKNISGVDSTLESVNYGQIICFYYDTHWIEAGANRNQRNVFIYFLLHDIDMIDPKCVESVVAKLNFFMQDMDKLQNIPDNLHERFEGLFRSLHTEVESYHNTSTPVGSVGQPRPVELVLPPVGQPRPVEPVLPPKKNESNQKQTYWILIVIVVLIFVYIDFRNRENNHALSQNIVSLQKEFSQYANISGEKFEVLQKEFSSYKDNVNTLQNLLKSIGILEQKEFAKVKQDLDKFLENLNEAVKFWEGANVKIQDKKTSPLILTENAFKIFVSSLDKTTREITKDEGYLKGLQNATQSLTDATGNLSKVIEKAAPIAESFKKFVDTASTAITAIGAIDTLTNLIQEKIDKMETLKKDVEENISGQFVLGNCHVVSMLELETITQKTDKRGNIVSTSVLVKIPQIEEKITKNGGLIVTKPKITFTDKKQENEWGTGTIMLLCPTAPKATTPTQ